MPKAATRTRLLAAGRELVAGGGGRVPSAGAVALRAGVSRLTIYHHFGSHAGLLRAVAESVRDDDEVATFAGAPRERLRAAVEGVCAHWARDPRLFRHLPAVDGPVTATIANDLAAALAEADQLRPGCSLREAGDVIGIVTSFPVFDRLHHDGRRPPAAVAEVLLRMCGAILAS